MSRENYKRPIDVINQANESNAPNFRCVNEGCCYHCEWLQTDLTTWHCVKHGMIFGGARIGDDDIESAVANQAEFICDDFEEIKSSWDETDTTVQCADQLEESYNCEYCGRRWPETETILPNGELGCDCLVERAKEEKEFLRELKALFIKYGVTLDSCDNYDCEECFCGTEFTLSGWGGIVINLRDLESLLWEAK